MLKIKLLLLGLLAPLLLLSQVTMHDTVITWQRFDYSLDPYYSISNYSTTNIIQVEFDGVVIENELIRICLVPEFGGRIISFVYKPTGHEQLFQNEVGVPYLIGDNIFYHDWLMVYGGIFPTFPEPEHGKYWNYPWSIEVLEESAEKVIVSMWLKDELDNPAHPGQYNNGVTGITCFFDVVVEAGKPTFDVEVRLENDGVNSNYEYWTNIGFTPGSDIGNTFSPSNSEMVVPIDYYQVAWNAGNWMQSADVTVQAGGPYVNEYTNLAWLSNWEDEGIAYAWPSLTENYFGVINHDEEEGLFRITDSPEKTPGFKFWTWGDEQGMNADAYDFNDRARPMIELWAGISHEFFTDAFLAANQSIFWKETYITTVGMPGVSFINDKLAFHQHLDPGNTMRIHMFLPVVEEQEEYMLEYEIRNSFSEVFWNADEMVDEDLTASHASLHDLGSLGLADGNYTWTTSIVRNGGELVYSEEEGFELATTAVLYHENEDLSLIVTNPHIGQLNIFLEGNSLSNIGIRVLDVQGRLVHYMDRMDASVRLTGLAAGLYVVQAILDKQILGDKVIVR